MDYLKEREKLCQRLGINPDTAIFSLADYSALKELENKLEILELKVAIKKEQAKNVTFKVVI